MRWWNWCVSARFPAISARNHEDIIDGLNACECSYPSQLAERRGHHRAHHWTADLLTEENKAFLAELPMTLRRDKLRLCMAVRTVSTNICCPT